MRGPHVWLNWQAARQGHPPRASSHPKRTIQVLPLWQEYSIYSDARIAGNLDAGPYKLIMSFDVQGRRGIGQLHRQLIVRVTDHLPDPEPDDGPVDTARAHDFTPNLDGWTGGDIGEQITALLSVALARRVRSSGVSRECFEGIGDSLGTPRGPDVAPFLEAPSGYAMIPQLAGEVRIEDAGPFLETYAGLSSKQSAIVLRAAGQYADALWWADADPRMSWIKLVGALETAANEFDQSTTSDPVELLKRHRGRLYGDLKRIDPRAAEVVARHLHGLVQAEDKLLAFTLAHAPAPPPQRPTIAQFDFGELESALSTI